MTVVQINGSYGNADSTGRTTKEMNNWFQDHGITSYCFVTKFNEGSCADSNVCLYGSKISFKYHSLLSHISGLQGYFSNFDTRKLIDRLKECNPDIVILRVLHNNSINFGMLTEYLAVNDIITILVLHDTWYFTGHCCGWAQFDCHKWEQKCGKCPAKNTDNVSWFFDTSAKCQRDKQRWFNRIPRLNVVGVSSFMENCAKKSILKEASGICTIYNWIDLERFYPMQYKPLRNKYGFTMENKIVMGAASYWAEGKGFSVFLRLAREMPDVDFVLIGLYDNSRMDYPINIQFVGKLNNPDLLAEYYSIANVLLNLSEYDSFGKVTAEAMACGVPVIAYNRSAAVELIGTERGRLCEYGDFMSIYNALADILSKDKDIWIKPLRSYAEENFDKEKNILKYIEIMKHGGR